MNDHAITALRKYPGLNELITGLTIPILFLCRWGTCNCYWTGLCNYSHRSVQVDFIYLKTGLNVSVGCLWKCNTKGFLGHEQQYQSNMINSYTTGRDISPWIKLIFSELDITLHVLASQLTGHCDVIGNLLWRHQQNVNRTIHTRGDMLSSF